MKLFRIVDFWQGMRRRVVGRSGRPSGVMLVSCGGLGDTVLFALVLPRFLQLAEAGERVSILLRRDAAKMAFLFPPEIEVVAVDFARLPSDFAYRAQVCRELHARNLRLVVATDYLRHPYLDETMIAACDAANTLGMEPRPWPKYAAALARGRGMYDRLFDSGPVMLDKVLRWSRFADWLTGHETPPPVVRLPAEILPPPSEPVAPTVMIQPFSAVKAKQSPPDLYREIIASLPSGFRASLLGTLNDLENNPDYRPILEMPGVDFDTSNFAELLPKLMAARLVISVDTALMHLAVAAGTPTICLASAAYVGEIVPYAPEITPDNVNFIYHPMPCQGCLGACIHPLQQGMYACVRAIDRREVLEKVVEAIRAGA